jgi:hypothetical protein
MTTTMTMTTTTTTMTDRPAVGARLIAVGGSVAATLALMAGMAWADQHAAPGTAPVDTSVQPGAPAAQPGFTPTDAPPVTSSRGS